ncbi:unnamed protein product [Sordaria macrospora k-hell]|uniref:WGS project CABT00000000 data, contig 2.3 n=1 Tax=Sordaria macrospora (strain ATCC MYA-333 / DSM 997 / K(L3346) / K-hell) TaxID=771870 RepID=F7VQ31_SORMK|nr:uncharacterized protein SMAC_08140 [Sordaria macrospora k-hell]CCC07609.1 unnamed protein product [Sordaria macrospora k-hell]
MLPPIDNSVLENNPQFANLYKGLTELLLNGDGSTKLPPQNSVAQERKSVTDELNKHRLKAAEETLLIHALSTTGPDPVPILIPERDSYQSGQRPSISGGLPVQRRFERPWLSQQSPVTVPPNLKQPLTDLLLLLPSFLALDFSSSSPEQPLDAETLSLILTSPPLSQLPSLLPYLGPLLSQTLHARASELTNIIRLAHPSITNSTPSTTTTGTPNLSSTSRLIPHLPNKISTLTTSTLPNLHTTLLKSRLTTSSNITTLLAKYTLALSSLIKTLEAKHGPIARSLEFKASETALLSRKAEKECELALLGIRREVYTPEVRRALVECGAWLRGEERRLREEVERGRGC